MTSSFLGLISERNLNNTVDVYIRRKKKKNITNNRQVHITNQLEESKQVKVENAFIT